MTDEKEIEEAAKAAHERELQYAAILKEHNLPTLFSYRRACEAGAEWATKCERERVLKELRGWSYMDSYIDEIERIINNAN